MKIKHEILHINSNLIKIRKNFLKSDADALFMQADYVILPGDAIEKLALQLQGNIKCISGWVPVNKVYGWNALRLVDDNMIAYIGNVQKSVIRVDFVTFECILISREILKKIKFSNKPKRQLSWVTGYKIVTNLFMNFCNDMYDNNYFIFMNGDVVCDRIFYDLPDIEDPEKIKKKDKVIVSFVADNNYAIPLSVAIKSLIDNFFENRELEIIVGSIGISKENKIKLKEIYPIKFIELKMDEVEKIKINILYHNSAIFGRLILLQLLNDYKKIIYLDVDIIINHDISDLWDIDLKNKTLAGAQDESILERDGCIYFNSGVLLINLESWRKKNVTKKAIKFVSKNITNFTDQDALNNILKKDFLRISKKWNRNPIYDIEKKETYILHFLGGEKPWWYGSKMEIISEYFEIIDNTPFCGWRPKSPLKEKEFVII